MRESKLYLFLTEGAPPVSPSCALVNFCMSISDAVETSEANALLNLYDKPTSTWGDGGRCRRVRTSERGGYAFAYAVPVSAGPLESVYGY